LSQIVGEIEAKSLEVAIPLGGALTTIPLGLSTGVTEVLLLACYSPDSLILEMVTSDTENSGATAGPMRAGIKGHWFVTLSPGEGITSLKAKNLSTTKDVTLEYLIGAVEKVGDLPDFWDD
jgi:hypothetical protein